MRRYSYSFSAWPDEARGFSRATFDLFRFLNGRVEMDFTRAEFETFRAALNHDGFTLREIGRVPHHEPESIP